MALGTQNLTKAFQSHQPFKIALQQKDFKMVDLIELPLLDFNVNSCVPRAACSLCTAPGGGGGGGVTCSIHVGRVRCIF